MGFVARAPRPFTRPGTPPKPTPALTPKPAPTSGREPNDVGPGLIDTTFEYRDLLVHGGDTNTISFTVSNAGRRRAAEAPNSFSPTPPTAGACASSAPNASNSNRAHPERST
jgi:hypothetical protein